MANAEGSLVRQRFTACELINCGKWRRAWRSQNKVIIRRALIVSLDMATSASRAKKIVQTQGKY
jgi:hypothetical protein